LCNIRGNLPGVLISLLDHELELLPARAVWWPAGRALVIADVHLGKDQVFRQSGVAIPAGVLEAELRALDRLLEMRPARRLLVLGDWVHAAPRAGDAWPGQVAAWRARHWRISITLVPGNHDRWLSPWLSDWDIGEAETSIEVNGLRLVHEVDPDDAAVGRAAGMSGHLHPVVRVGRGAERMRLPAFARRGDHLILPAFGRFTGGFDGLDPRAWDMYPVAEDRVVGLASRAAGRESG